MTRVSPDQLDRQFPPGQDDVRPHHLHAGTLVVSCSAFRGGIGGADKGEKATKLKPIHNDDDYAAALQEIDRLWDAVEGSPEADTLEILVTLVEAYEKGRYELPPPDPIEAL
jgi:hypothetical protein